MKKKHFHLIIFTLLLFLPLSGCVRHTHYWTVEVEVYNSTLKNCFINIDGRTEIISARTWKTFTINCSDSEVYCDLFEDYRYRYECYWDCKLYDSNIAGSGMNVLWEEDSVVQFKLYYNNTSNIVYLDRVY
ncbi:MAG: hypothetical protein PHV06_10150 [bacterium]|nr:hypothetical protein [bacterium]